MKFSYRRYIKGSTFDERYMKGLPVLSKIIYKRIRDWTWGQSLPVWSSFEYLHHPHPPCWGLFNADQHSSACCSPPWGYDHWCWRPRRHSSHWLTLYESKVRLCHHTSGYTACNSYECNQKQRSRSRTNDHRSTAGRSNRCSWLQTRPTIHWCCRSC